MSNFWCEVDLKKLNDNIDVIKKLVGNKKIIGVIKGDAYGLGIEKISEFLSNKIDILAVATKEESEKVYSNTDILLLSPLCCKNDFNDERENLIFSIDNEKILDEIPKDRDKRVHIYVDTGMNRMGIKPNRLDYFINLINKDYKNIKIEGIYTHLHNCKNIKYTLNQVNIFKETVKKYIGEIPNIHCMASSAIINDEIRKAAEFTTVVRAGNILYGYIGFNKGIKKTYEYYANIINTYKVVKGEHIGYSALFKAKEDMNIGIIECGNVHGLGTTRETSNNLLYDIFRLIYRKFKKRHVIFCEGKAVNIIGKPNMNITIVDMKNVSKNSKLRIDISPIISEGSIDKIYNIE
ncbi:alanine racemase [Clostridium tarantellae]|uniref:Alanine racemase n=1 Tax=Clostridium tarantellae TaxID=39493 RepID=A0A6I1MMH5_9CLOT|nr:alanine racemase [Clostridium tarantellae]MPQ43963.1 alanine racemase [Clostridium tarantellae]